jgi:hypothetical protein
MLKLRSSIVYTRDERVPLSADDRAMLNGWRCVPVPPTDDNGWIITDDRSDKATGWCRKSQIIIGETVSRRH